MRRTAQARGVRLDSLARQVTSGDLEAFDLIVAMDRENLKSLERLRERAAPDARIVLMRDFDPAPDSPDVPDPYFGGEAGFHDTYRIVERCCEGLIEALDS